VLLSIEPLRRYFIRKLFLSINFPTFEPQQTLSNNIAKLFKEMVTLEEEYDHLKPTFFYKLVERRFSRALQHDAHEFMMYLLGALQDELNPCPKRSEIGKRFTMTSSQSSEFWNNYQQAHPSIIDTHFVGQLSRTVQCKQCKNSSTSYEPFKDLTLTVAPTLADSLQLFLASESL
jgi:ubiquitin C-terminal hydrolase